MPAARQPAATSSSPKPSRRWACSVLSELVVMRGEIDDHQPSAGAQHARGLGQRLRRVPRRNAAPDGPAPRRTRRIGQRQLVHVGLADLTVPQAGALQVGAGDSQHLARQIDAEARSTRAPAAPACGRCRCRGRADPGCRRPAGVRAAPLRHPAPAHEASGSRASARRSRGNTRRLPPPAPA